MNYEAECCFTTDIITSLLEIFATLANRVLAINNGLLSQALVRPLAGTRGMIYTPLPNEHAA